MKVDKLSISLDPGLGDAVRAAAERTGTSVSAWIANAAASQLRHEALAQFLGEWQGEHGAITADEIAKVRAELGYGRTDSSAA